MCMVTSVERVRARVKKVLVYVPLKPKSKTVNKAKSSHREFRAALNYLSNFLIYVADNKY